MRAALLLLLAQALVSAKDVPDWVHEAARQAVKSEYPPQVATVVLLAEERLAVDPDGKQAMTERRATKILQPGRENLTAFREYNTKAGRIRDFRAWLVLPSGKEIEYGKERVLDVSINNDKTPYNEERAKLIECDPGVPVGSVFAYEVTEEEATIFTTDYYLFQESAPVLVSRFILSLPAAWEARGTFFNHGDLAPITDGNTYTWELRDLPWIADEAYSPSHFAMAPRLGVTFFPSSAAKPELVPFKDWHSVSAWHAGFADPSAEVTPSIRAKSDELTQGKNTEADKIRAIARFVQQTNYVAVDLNLMHGGGYVPRPASQVLAKNYGDCKDKAALMRALLKAAGIDSYEVAIHAGDRRFVRPEWPSPMQFNHAIVAVKVSAATNLPTVIEHSGLGRLLIFDPTDPTTPVGDLPWEEQGSYALVIAGPDGDLMKMPALPPAHNRIDRVVDVQWNGGGGVLARIVTQYFGQSGSAMRYQAQQGGLDELRRGLERAYSRRLGAVTLDKVEATDHADDGWFGLAVDFGVQQFGQLMQGRMLVFRPGTLAPDPDYAFPSKQRQLPVKLSARLRKDTITVRLPPGFAVDEAPDPTEVESAYGAYRASWKTSGGSVTFEQVLEVKDTLAGAEDYTKVKDFFDKVSGAQSAPVVLLKR